MNYINKIVKLAAEFEEMIPETLRTPYSSEYSFSTPVVETELSGDVLELKDNLSDLESKIDPLFYILKNIKENIQSSKSALITSDKEQLYLDLDTYLYSIKKSFLSFESSLKKMPEIKNKIIEVANMHVQLGQQQD